MSEISQQYILFEHWIAAHYPHSSFKLQPLIAGAGLRRYFRVIFENKTEVLMVVPANAEVSLKNVIAVDSAFSALGVRVPKLYYYDLEAGLLLLEDFGDALYEQNLTNANVDRYYQQALDQLLLIQTCKTIPDYVEPHFLSDYFSIDMQLWQEWFVQGYWHETIEPSLLVKLMAVLQDAIQTQPAVCMHRDYHSRNLLILANGSTGVIDFQSAMRGPIMYDAVSLLRDCYLRWPEAKVSEWATYFFNRINKNNHYSEAQLWHWFDLTGLQRHLKALGTFARKYLRDNATEYLADINRTLLYVTAVTAKYPELAEFHAWFSARTPVPNYSLSQET